ncbi:TIGR04282 family arsenosugar biosynthesis glycosyltransferase [Cytophaga sp. FL35]|uniref:TIGR04282 family arsenosugar biosynthesis glycosyltransferase n=1 Tax=Cytophaga sp. FL35 TaxID=1904456 RepID=UPI001653EE73|nr:TIGR04282 family arsenosugar biosynthesis glycosyltransferase [Cytophaga sp. FL35]MBC6998976.1 TIGR04282 family arsenosugar biosynthesis glycosyltransferase [Cytophaga sp. FL35]
MNTNNLLLIFTRNPELGKCKTRLAATIGDQAALNIYNFLLEHTHNITHKLACYKQVWYSEDIWENDIWDATFFEKKLQKGETLGDRMALAFKKGFAAGFHRIVVIGSDMFHLAAKDIDDAFNHLLDNDYVIGPAEDGGYYLLGMNTYNEDIFKNKQWGTDTVLQSTLKDITNDSCVLLEERNDIDLYDDIKDIDAFQPFLKNHKE